MKSGLLKSKFDTNFAQFRQSTAGNCKYFAREAAGIFVPYLVSYVLGRTFSDRRLFNFSRDHQDLPLLILSHFRWLDHVVDPKALAEKLLEILPILNVKLQKDVIALLPEIVDDLEQEVIEERHRFLHTH
jgi:hypothetical protein